METPNILILIDFGEDTPSLLRYGWQLSQAVQARVWVQHVYYIPPDLAGEVLIPIDALKKYETQARQQFEQLKESIVPPAEPEPDFVISHGDLVVQVSRLVEEENIQLVVVGSRGGGLSANILGCHTLKVIHHMPCPVLSVPKQAVFQPFRRIAFAADWHQRSAGGIGRLKQFARYFKTHLDIIHVSEKNEPPREEIDREGYDLGELSPTFYYLWAKDVEEGLREHVAEHRNDLIVLVPHHPTLFDRLFQKSVTRQMVYHSHIPLLTLPES